MSSTTASQPDFPSLAELIARAPGFGIEAPDACLRSSEIGFTTVLDGRRDAFAGKAVLVATRGQVASARVLIELDGIAARLVICPPDFTAERLNAVATLAEVDVIVTDRTDLEFGAERPVYSCRAPQAASPPDIAYRVTEWVLPTSGTTGAPKLVIHGLAELTGAIKPMTSPTPIWATFYDIRRYGGLQIFLRAALAGSALILTDPSEALGDFLARCGEAGVTHLTGTPSHWRRVLMGSYSALINPAYVRLSGEIADAAVLASLRSAFPDARIVHAYASTEAGVGFEVNDEKEGFPLSYVGGLPGVDMKIVDGSLRIRSSRTAKGYIGRPDAPLLDVDGFVDTDDLVEVIGDRCLFRGRRTGVVNIGGLKVHPEEVESVINAHPDVRMSLVRARRNPIMGDIIVADLVLKDDAIDATALRDDILSHCRARLERHKVPVTLKFVPSLALVAGGKLARNNA